MASDRPLVISVSQETLSPYEVDQKNIIQVMDALLAGPTLTQEQREFLLDFFPQALTGKVDLKVPGKKSHKLAVRNHLIMRACMSIKEIWNLLSTPRGEAFAEYMRRFEANAWPKYRDGVSKPKSEAHRLLVQAHEFSEELPCGPTELRNILKGSVNL